MTEKDLRDMEAAMTKEKIIERAKTLRPVADFKELGGSLTERCSHLPGAKVRKLF